MLILSLCDESNVSTFCGNFMHDTDVKSSQREVGIGDRTL